MPKTGNVLVSRSGVKSAEDPRKLLPGHPIYFVRNHNDVNAIFVVLEPVPRNRRGGILSSRAKDLRVGAYERCPDT